MRVLSYVSTLFLARALLVSEFGVYSLLMSVLGTLVALSALGLPQAFIYFTGKRKAAANELLQVLYLFWVLIAALSSLIIFALSRIQVPDITGLVYAGPLLLLYIVKLLDYYLLSFLRAHQRFKIYNLKKLFEAVLVLISLGLLYMLGAFQIGNILWANILIAIIWIAVQVIYIHRTIVEDFFPLMFRYHLAREIIRFGLKSYLQILVTHLNYQIAAYLIVWLLSEKELGIYTVAVGLGATLWFLPDTLGIILLPALSSERNRARVNEKTATILRHTFYIILMGIITLLVVGKPLLLFIYGAKYGSAFVPMLLLLPGILAMSLYKVLTRYFTSQNLQQIPIFVAGGSLILAVLINIILIKLFDLMGAAMATSLVFCLTTGLLLYFFKRTSSLPVSSVFKPRTEDVLTYTNFARQILGRG